MSVKIKVQMTSKAMYDFLLYHTYSSMNGKVGVLFGGVTAGLGVRALVRGEYNAGMMFLFLATVFLVLTPMTLKSKAGTQVKMTPMFQKPIDYELTDDGIVVSQDDQQTEVKWDELNKAVSTKHSLIIYVTRVRALIFPKEALGEQYEEAVQMIASHLPPAKMKIRREK